VDSRMVLFAMTALAGFVMVVGGMWLIYKEKIYIDRESNKPIEVKLPGNFSFTSNFPALALFALGFFPLIYPLTQLKTLTRYVKVTNVKIKGLVHSPAYPALVYAAEVPAPVVNDGDGFNVAVPVISGEEEYKVLLIVDGHVLDSEAVSAMKRTKDEITVEFKPVTIDPPQYKAEIKPLPPAYQ
jgi:hypothetical protein